MKYHQIMSYVVNMKLWGIMIQQMKLSHTCTCIHLIVQWPKIVLGADYTCTTIALISNANEYNYNVVLMPR